MRNRSQELHIPRKLPKKRNYIQGGCPHKPYFNVGRVQAGRGVKQIRRTLAQSEANCQNTEWQCPALPRREEIYIDAVRDANEPILRETLLDETPKGELAWNTYVVSLLVLSELKIQ